MQSESRDECLFLICMSLLHECGTCFYPFNNLFDSLVVVSTPAFPELHTLSNVQSNAKLAKYSVGFHHIQQWFFLGSNYSHLFFFST
jgi:hypothetical protein